MIGDFSKGGGGGGGGGNSGRNDCRMQSMSFLGGSGDMAPGHPPRNF